jgi:hypothetical protein
VTQPTWLQLSTATDRHLAGFDDIAAASLDRDDPDFWTRHHGLPTTVLRLLDWTYGTIFGLMPLYWNPSTMDTMSARSSGLRQHITTPQ